MARVDIKNYFPISKSDVEHAFIEWRVDEAPNRGGIVFDISEPWFGDSKSGKSGKFAEITLTVKGYILAGLGHTVWEGTTERELEKDAEELADFLDDKDLWPSLQLNESKTESPLKESISSLTNSFRVNPVSAIAGANISNKNPKKDDKNKPKPKLDFAAILQQETDKLKK